MRKEFAMRLRNALNNLLFEDPKQTESKERVSISSTCLSLTSVDLDDSVPGSWAADLDDVEVG